MVAAFFAAVTPAELEAWRRAHDARCQADEALDRAEAQQVERLRYQALLAERQFNKVDPDNRLVAGELEHRWEVALRELRQAEDLLARHRGARAAPEMLSAEDRESFLALGPAVASPLAAPRHDAGAQEGAAPQSDRQSRSAAGWPPTGSAFASSGAAAKSPISRSRPRCIPIGP